MGFCQNASFRVSFYLVYYADCPACLFQQYQVGRDSCADPIILDVYLHNLLSHQILTAEYDDGGYQQYLQKQLICL